MAANTHACTGDGAEIELGMAMWNYDLSLDWVVEPLDGGGDYFVTGLGWIISSAAMLKRHPLTGQLADDAAESTPR